MLDPTPCQSPDRALLRRMLDEQLDADTYRRVEAHVETCPACQSALEQVASRFSPFTPPVPIDDTDDAPPTIAGYALTAPLGMGGMGVVFSGTEVELNREVAVKVLRRSLFESEDRDELIARFVQEAHISARLQHPGIPPVHRLGTLPDGRPFLAMRVVKGRTLAELLADPAWDRGRAVPLFEKVCETVAYAHQQDIIHRDLKPSNVMVGEFGEVQVMDWGLARQVRSAATSGRQEHADAVPVSPSDLPAPRAGWTEAGRVLGTRAYMPPEQASGQVERVGTAADVFALGGILCHMLTAAPPNTGDAFARLDGSGADRPLVELAKKCLAPNPDDRPANAGAVAAAVTAYRQSVEERAKRAEVERAQAEAAKEKLELQAAEGRKRRRLIAVAAAVIVVGLVVGIVTVEGERRQTVVERDAKGKAFGELEVSRNDERTAKDAALANATLARANERRARDEGYAATVTFANSQRDRGRLKEFAALLDGLIPTGADEYDPRGVEWGILRRMDASGSQGRVDSGTPVRLASFAALGLVTTNEPQGDAGSRVMTASLPGGKWQALASLPAKLSAKVGVSADQKWVVYATPQQVRAEPVGGPPAKGVAVDVPKGVAKWEYAAAGNRAAVLTKGGELWLIDVAGGKVLRKWECDTDPKAGAIAVTPSGERVAACGPLGVGSLFDDADDAKPREFTGSRVVGAVQLAFSADGDTLACGGFDGVRVLSAATGELRDVIPGSFSISPVRLSAKGKLLAFLTDETSLSVFNLSDRMPVARFFSGGAAITGFEFHPSLKGLAVKVADGAAVWWEYGSAQQHFVRVGDGSPFPTVLPTADGNLLIGGGDAKRGVLTRRDLNTGRAVTTYQGALPPVQAVAASSDGRLAARAHSTISGEDSSCVLFHPSTGDELARLPLDVSPQYLAFSPDGTAVAVGCGNMVGSARKGQVLVWDVKTRKVTATLKLNDEIAFRVAFGDDGRTLFVGTITGPFGKSNASCLLRWDTTKETAEPLLSSLSGVLAIQPLPRTNTVAVSVGPFTSWKGGRIVLLDCDDPKKTRDIVTSKGVFFCLGYHPTRDELLAGDSLGQLTTFGADRKPTPDRLPKPGLPVFCLSVTGDGERVCLGTGDATSMRSEVVVLGATDLKEQGGLTAPDGLVVSLAATADRVLMGTNAGNVRSVGVTGGSPVTVGTADGHGAAVSSLCLTADESVLYSGAADGTLREWAAGGGRMTRALPTLTGSVNGLVATAKGRQLVCATGGANRKPARGDVVVIHTGDGDRREVLATCEKGYLQLSSAGDQEFLWAVNGDGEFVVWRRQANAWVKRELSVEGYGLAATARPGSSEVAVSLADGTIEIWNLQSNQRVSAFGSHKTTPVIFLCFSPDGRTLVTAHMQSDRLHLWQASTGRALADFAHPLGRILSPQALFAGGGKDLFAVGLSADFLSTHAVRWSGSEPTKPAP